MSEIKYTKSGKKVAVVGKINNTQWLVQEIFVTQDGTEIPGGENIVETALFDQPVETWQERQHAELKDNHEKLSKQIKKMKSEVHSLTERKARILDIENIRLKTLESFEGFNLSRLEMVLSGRAKWAIELCHYHPTEPIPFDEALHGEDRVWGPDTWIKLLTLFGNSKGDLSFGINRYKDGSGADSTYAFAETKEEAQKLLQEHWDRIFSDKDRRRKFDSIEGLQKFIDAGIRLPKEVVDECIAEVLKGCEKRLAELKQETEGVIKKRQEAWSYGGAL